MIILPLLTNLWMILALMVVGGIALALLDRLFPLRPLPAGLGILGALFVEEIGSVLYAHFSGDEKALPLIWALAFFFVALAMIYGITKAAFRAWPQGSKSP
jgi:hypothetical protein